MAAVFAFSTEIGVYTALGHGEGLEVAAEGQAVGVVVAAAVLRDMLAPAEDAAHPGHFVRRDGDADPAAADDDRDGVLAAVLERFAGQPGEVRVVDAPVGAVTAVVDAGMAEAGQVVAELSLEPVAAVVAAEVDLHITLPRMAIASRLPRNITISTRIRRR